MTTQEDVLTRFGSRLREMRRERKMSQGDLGLETGLEQAYLSDVELGRRNISLRNINALANALNVTLSELFIGIS